MEVEPDVDEEEAVEENLKEGSGVCEMSMKEKGDTPGGGTRGNTDGQTYVDHIEGRAAESVKPGQFQGRDE